MSWNKIICNHREVQLLGTLNGGQSFRWKHDKDTDEWTGVFSKTVWKLRKMDECLQYQVVGSLLNSNCVNAEEFYTGLLRKYFRLDVDLGAYYRQWSESDELFRTASQRFYGIRMLAQEPVENLFSFICSQNNHISRISTMVESLCSNYGEEICKHEGVTYYSFPQVEKLSEPEVKNLGLLVTYALSKKGWRQKLLIETKLRKLKFGYRAKFIHMSAKDIVEWGGEAWFKKLQEMSYKDARKELVKLHGVGPKVADCICLMSLNHLEALPVDTHVFNIAANYYLPHLKGKTVTEKSYQQIGDHFRNLYGDLAGWAHTVLFCADLKFMVLKRSPNGDSIKDVIKKKKTTCDKKK